MKIDSILQPIHHEIEHFRVSFKEAMMSEVGLLDKVAAFILKQKGKQIRPALVLLSAKATGSITQSTYRAAALVELLHTATLIHDDVVDTADMRRGLPAINALWKNKVAVLMGDYLLSRGLLLSLKHKDYQFLEIISDAVRRMSEGELLQIEKTRHLDIDEKTYFRIISDKTASLISTACFIGAVSSTEDPALQDGLCRYGEALGIAFQIRDDILDYLGKSDKTGKPIGGDIKEKKITLPLIYALNTASIESREYIMSILRSDRKRALFSKEVISFTRNQGGIAYAEKVAIQYVQTAIGALSLCPESDAKSSLLDLAEFAAVRQS